MITTSVIVARQLFDPIAHEAIQAFIRERVPMMSLGVDDTVFMRRHAHNVPYFAGIHRQLTDYASEMFGEPVKPSYSFLSLYQHGGTCPLHIDRPQCRWTIDYLIQQDQAEPWPIKIGDAMSDEQRQDLEQTGEISLSDDEQIAKRIAAESWSEVLLSPNDAVCYSGTHQWHYRPERLTGTAALVFFHFVPIEFEGSLD